MFSEDRKTVALIKRSKKDFQEGMLNGIGGGIELDQTPMQAQIAEFEEEAGVVTTANDWE